QGRSPRRSGAPTDQLDPSGRPDLRCRASRTLARGEPDRGGVSGRVFVVVASPADLPGIPTDRLITADRYLAGADGATRGATVVNLCRSYRYGSKGYYVSLIADARGQRAVPTAEGLEGLSERFGVLRILHEAGVPTVETSEGLARRRAPNGGSGPSGKRAKEQNGARNELEVL